MSTPDVTEQVNEFTGLISYFCGLAAMTAMHNHAPLNGNWQYAVGRPGYAPRWFVGDDAFSEAMAYLVELGRMEVVA